jgi:MFS family permease
LSTFKKKQWRTYILLKLRNDFSFFVLGQVFSQIGENMSKVSLVWLVFSMAGANNHVSSLSLLFLAQSAPALLFGWLCGHVIDSCPSKRHLLFYADTLRGLLFCLIPALYLLHVLTLSLLYLLTFLAAIFSGLFGPAMFSMIPEFPADSGTLVSRNATINVTGHIGILVGPLVGGVLSYLFPPGIVVLATGATFLISALFIWKIIGERQLTKNACWLHARAIWDLWSTSWRLLKEACTKNGFQNHILKNVLYAVTLNPATRLFCGMAFLVGLTLGPVNVLVPVYVKNILHGNSIILGLLFASAGAGMLVASLFLSRSKHDFGVFYKHPDLLPEQEMLLIGALFVSGMLVVPTGLIHDVVVIAVVTFLAAGLADVFNPVMQTEIQTAVSPDKTGRVFTSVGTFFLAGFVLGTISTPAITGFVGVTGAFVLVGGLRIVSAILPLFLRTANRYFPWRVRL